MDLTFLEENYRTMPLSDIARTLGRTPGSIRLMAHKLACQEKVLSRWIAKEDEIIRQHYTAGAGVAFIVTLREGWVSEIQMPGEMYMVSPAGIEPAISP